MLRHSAILSLFFILIFSLLTFGKASLATELPNATKQIMNHLEYMGYTCEIKSGESSDFKYVLAKHKTHFNFIISDLAKGIQLLASFELNQLGNTSNSQVLKIVNEFNSKNSVLITAYLDKNTEGKWYVRASARMPDFYAKQAFSDFIERWQKDINKLVGNEDLSPYLE